PAHWTRLIQKFEVYWARPILKAPSGQKRSWSHRQRQQTSWWLKPGQSMFPSSSPGRLRCRFSRTKHGRNSGRHMAVETSIEALAETTIVSIVDNFVTNIDSALH